MNQTSAMLPHDRDEFTFSGLTPAASLLVKAPRVAESPVNFECRLSQCIQLTGADGTPVDTWLVLGKWSVSILPNRCWKRDLPDGESAAHPACGWADGVLWDQ